MPETLQGMADTIRKLEAVAGENGTVAKKSLRRALRAGCKYLAAVMIRVIPANTGTSKSRVKVSAGKRSRSGMSMVAGPVGEGYFGFSNYGYKTQSGSEVQGSQWTDLIKSIVPEATAVVEQTLKDEVERIARTGES